VESKQRRRLTWLAERDQLRCELPGGPCSQADWANWPLDLMRNLTCRGVGFDEERILRVSTLLSGPGMCVYTDYSGFECPREALRLGLAGLEKLHNFSFGDRPIRFARSCDNAVLPSGVLQHLLQHVATTQDRGESCVFFDILDRLPEPARQRIEASLPEVSASATDKKEAPMEVKAYLAEAEHSVWCFHPLATSRCVAHQRQCPTRPVATKLYCNGADKYPEALPPPTPSQVAGRPLCVNVAGVSCLPWTAGGSGDGDQSPCEIPHQTWLLERREKAKQLLEDIFFVECTPRYPIGRKVAEVLQDTHLALWVKTGPEMCGWPRKRLRVLGVGLNRKTVAFSGPEDAASLQAHFESFFHKGISMDGKDLLRAPAEMREAECIQLARTQKFQLTAEHLRETPKDELLRMLFPPGAVARLDAWMRHLSALDTTQMDPMFDLDHHATSKGSTAGPDWPVSLRHGSVMSVREGDPNSWTLACSAEALAALGWHLFPTDGSEFGPSPLCDHLLSLTSAQQKVLAGNGMRLVTQANWMWYVFAHVSRKRPVTAGCERRWTSSGSCEFMPDESQDRR
jgi:hypothetical protein